MPALGALTLAWTAAEAALPLGWRVSGLYRFGDVWIGLAEGPEFGDYATARVATSSRHCSGSATACASAEGRSTADPSVRHAACSTHGHG